MRAIDLNQYQREQFTECFYNMLEIYVDDMTSDNPYPWGCPWLWAENEKLEGQDVPEMVKNFVDKHEKEILELYQQDYTGDAL